MPISLALCETTVKEGKAILETLSSEKPIIDIGNYRSRKEKRLQSIAFEAANKVRKTKRAVLLEPMNPFERRIVHMSLKKERFIETISEGDSTIKRIRVIFNDKKSES